MHGAFSDLAYAARTGSQGTSSSAQPCAPKLWPCTMHEQLETPLSTACRELELPIGQISSTIWFDRGDLQMSLL